MADAATLHGALVDTRERGTLPGALPPAGSVSVRCRSTRRTRRTPPSTSSRSDGRGSCSTGRTRPTTRWN